MKRRKSNSLFRKFIFVLLSAGILTASLFYCVIIKNNYKTQNGEKIYIEILKNSTIDVVIKKLNKHGNLGADWSFKLLSKLKKYDNNIKPGNYQLEGPYNNNDLINLLRQRKDHTFKLIIPENIRKYEDVFSLIEDSIGFADSSMTLYIKNSDFLTDNKLTLEKLPGIFIPNTYEFYSNISVSQFFERMIVEYEKFWNSERAAKCDSINLSQIEVITLASIIEEEQDRRIEERPMIAGLYLNRIKQQIKLQSDPTVIFANNDFSIRRVLNKHLRFESPYNTYIYFGLPPGPICIPSINAIDAVLNAEQHEYIFMCAKGDASGLHNFAITNREHNNNRAQYKKNMNFN